MYWNIVQIYVHRDEVHVPRVKPVNGMPQKQSQTNRIALAPFGIIFHR